MTVVIRSDRGGCTEEVEGDRQEEYHLRTAFVTNSRVHRS
jgi:hypothetical protein